MFRRDLTLFGKCILSGIVVTVVLAMLFAVVAGLIIDRSKDVFTPVKVAVVDGDDSFYSRIIINMVKNLGYISDLLEIERVDTDEPEALTEQGYAAVIVLPQGYLNDILSAHVSGGSVIVSPSLGAGREIVMSVARFGEVMLAAGQNGTFSGLYLIKEHGLSSDVRSAYLDEVNLTLVNEAFNSHDKYVSVKTLDYDGTGLSIEAYYAVCWLTLLAMMLSVFFISLYTRDLTHPILCRLRSCGANVPDFWRWKFVFTFAFRLLFVCAALLVMSLFGMAEFGFAAVCCACVASLFMTVCGIALTAFSRDGITVNLIVAAGGLLLCGGIVPRQLLPEILLMIGDFTPFGVARSLLAPAFGANVDVTAVLFAFIYAVGAVYIVYRRTARVTVEEEG